MKTTQDIATLARAAGAAGQSWAQLTCDDAVQDYVCDHDATDADLAMWRAAFDAGEAEHLTAQGWLSRWTTAPTDYDCFGTTTAEQCGDWYGKPLRHILCHPHHAGYQAGRNSSGNHPTWDEDPRIEERVAAERAERWKVEDAARAARRTTGLAWLTAATEAEIDDAKDRDEVESRGLTYVDLRDELQRRADTIAAAERAATWTRCRAAFDDGAIIIDDGTPGFRGVYGWISGQPTRIHYDARVTEHYAHPGDAEHATVSEAGSLAYVADWIASGRMRVVSPGDVPPEPVVKRIGHECWKDIRRVEVVGRTVWVGRARGAYEMLVLDERGRIVRAKAVLAAATTAASPTSTT